MLHTCAIVDREMELVKACLSIHMNLVNLEFINNWSLESTTGQAAIELAPGSPPCAQMGSQIRQGTVQEQKEKFRAGVHCPQHHL
jgi:hypothetical protein